MVAQIDTLRTVAQAREVIFSGVHERGAPPAGAKVLIARGELADYRCAYGFAMEKDDGTVTLDGASATLLALEPGERFAIVAR
jgi:arginine N-succinyltransferase